MFYQFKTTIWMLPIIGEQLKRILPVGMRKQIFKI